MHNRQLMTKIFIVAFLALAAFGLVPQPKHISLEQQHIQLTSVPTLITSLPFDPIFYFNNVVNRKLSHLSRTDSTTSIPISVTFANIGKEEYHLSIKQQSIALVVGSYSGYVYGLETLFQLIDSQDRLPLGNIKDEPALPHRGIMIDTVRHFISVESLKRVIRTMPMAKLNVLHWHLFDNEAFPFKSSTNPELQGAAYHKASTYSRDDIQELIVFAQQHAVQIVPEIESPAHVKSWGQNSVWKPQNIIISCDSFHGQLDVSKQKAYELFANVTFQIDALFRKSDYIHMGGRQLNETCWTNNANIKAFMLLHNIKTVEHLQLYWQKELRKNIGGTRKVIYWRDKAPELTLEDEVIIQYYGNQSDIGALALKTKNKLILSPADILDLSTAMGDYRGDKTNKRYITANQIYLKFNPFPEGVDSNRILGAQVTLWTGMANEATLDSNLWMRAAAFADRVWSNSTTNTSSFVRRMVALSGELEKADVTPSPILSQYCETYPQVCFPDGPQYNDHQLPGQYVTE